jgi:hypothetical protein
VVKPTIAVIGEAPSMTLFCLFPGKSFRLPPSNSWVSAPDAGIPPVHYLFYQEACGAPIAASLLSRRR